MEVAKEVAVGHIPAGFFIVCCKDPTTQKIDGFLASWVQQAGFEPLLISLAVKPGRPAYEQIISGRPFSINIVGEQNRSLLKYFWKGYDPTENPFNEISYSEPLPGVIVLQEAKAVMAVQLHSHVRPSDHDIVFAEVIGSYLIQPDIKSLVHLRKSGNEY